MFSKPRSFERGFLLRKTNMKKNDELKKIVLKEMIMKDLISFQAKETARITEQVIIRKMIKDRKMKKNKPKDKK